MLCKLFAMSGFEQFVKPVLLLSCLAVHFEDFVIGGLGPPS